MKARYSDIELEEFRLLILEKLEFAKTELNGIETQMMELRENMSDEQGGDWFDDSSIHTEIEFMTKLAERQRHFVQNLELALVRIKNKSYGICAVTGELIDKQRLLLVPHATKSVLAKERETHLPNLENQRPSSNFESEDSEDSEDTMIEE
ncbi:MAG: TraR/DksA C4-type zinc finger protein [Saprospiraceae bacterium]